MKEDGRRGKGEVGHLATAWNACPGSRRFQED